MVMSFFRRAEDGGKSLSTTGYRPASITDQRPAAEEPLRYAIPDVNDFAAFGSALEENQRTSEDLLSSLTSLQERVSSLLGTHSQSLNETGALRAECARISSLLDYESHARQKADQDNLRLTAENKAFYADNAQLRSEIDAFRDELTKLQSVHQVTREEFTIIENRLLDAERELTDRAIQFDEASTLLKRAQTELDQRSRELSATREKLDNETTAHQLLIETSRRENGTQAREMARLNEERSHLKSSLIEQEAQVRNLQMAVASLKQDLALFEERHKRLEVEHETLQASSALEIAHLTTKHEAIGSKAELVEKLLVTANGRNKMTDEELQAARADLKRVKSELVTALSRSERLAEELQRARTTGAESESARRELATQTNELTLKLREAESLRVRRDRDADALRRDIDTRMDSDRYEIGQLRTSLEIAKSEIRQLRAERAILTGQLEVARSERPGVLVPTAALEERDEVRMPAAGFTPMIDISEKSLRAPSADSTPAE
jgi:chromosome segregation ATPase